MVDRKPYVQRLCKNIAKFVAKKAKKNAHKKRDVTGALPKQGTTQKDPQ